MSEIPIVPEPISIQYGDVCIYEGQVYIVSSTLNSEIGFSIGINKYEEPNSESIIVNENELSMLVGFEFVAGISNGLDDYSQNVKLSKYKIIRTTGEGDELTCTIRPMNEGNHGQEINVPLLVIISWLSSSHNTI